MPITVKGEPFSRMVEPTTSGLPAKRFRQKSYWSTATGVAVAVLVVFGRKQPAGVDRDAQDVEDSFRQPVRRRSFRCGLRRPGCRVRRAGR